MAEQYWDMLGLNRNGIQISKRAPKELVLRVLAAVLSYEMGRKSIDYTYKVYKEIWEKELLPPDR